MPAHATTVTPAKASEPGALDGFRVECSCGERCGFSIESMARKHAADHVAYMAKVGR